MKKIKSNKDPKIAGSIKKDAEVENFTPMTCTPEWMTFMTARFEAIDRGFIEGSEKYNEHINNAMNKLKNK